MAIKKIYITKAGDQWDAIAKAVYGSEVHVTWLTANNAEHLDVFEFGGGVILNIPDLPESQSSSLPPWRRA